MPPDLHAFCSNTLGTHELSITPRPPAAFQSNALHDVRARNGHYIAKVYLKQREWDDAPHREFLGLKLVEALDIAPRVIAMKAAPEPVVLYEFLPGQAWDRRVPQPGDLDALLDLLLRMQALHSDHPRLAHRPNSALSHDYARAIFDRYVAWCDRRHPAGRATAALCQRAIEQAEPAFQDLAQERFVPRFTKPDMRFANVIARPDGRLALVDWEDSMLGDPAFDLADMLTAPNQEDLVPWRAWAPIWRRCFDAHRAADPRMAERAARHAQICAIYWLTLVGKGMQLAEAGQPPHFDINSMLSEQRLRRFLARALAPEPAAFDDTLTALPETCFFPDASR